MVTQPKTEQEAKAMREALQKYDQAAAQEAHEAALEKFAPLAAMVEADSFDKLISDLRANRLPFMDEPDVVVHITPAADILERLRTAVRSRVAPPLPVVAPEANPAPDA